jgi:hypothetical protein
VEATAVEDEGAELTAAFLMASISPWAVGPLVAITRFQPSPMMSPSLTITVPKGPPSPAWALVTQLDRAQHGAFRKLLVHAAHHRLISANTPQPRYSRLYVA